MVIAYWVVQFAAAAAGGSLLARAFEATAAKGTPLHRGTKEQETSVPASRRPISPLVTT